MNTLYMLVGVPCSGKTTFRKKYFNPKRDGCVQISFDDVIESLAQLYGLTYNETFKFFSEQAMAIVNLRAIQAFNAKQSVVIDQTNLSVASRFKKLELFPGYRKVCYVFRTPKENIWKSRLKLSALDGKEVPEEVLAKMSSGFEEPTKAEGFEEITYIPDVIQSL